MNVTFYDNSIVPTDLNSSTIYKTWVVTGTTLWTKHAEKSKRDWIWVEESGILTPSPPPLVLICPLTILQSCPVWLFVFRAPLSARQDCSIHVRKRPSLWCEAAMTTSAMFPSDLSISVNKCIVTLPQTVTHSSGERLSHCSLLALPGWTPSNGNATDTHIMYRYIMYIWCIYMCVCVCVCMVWKDRQGCWCKCWGSLPPQCLYSLMYFIKCLLY